jgi:hypothetical protein
MSNLDNQPDPSWIEVQIGNAQAEEMRKLIRSKLPRTDWLLSGIRFQYPYAAKPITTTTSTPPIGTARCSWMD